MKKRYIILIIIIAMIFIGSIYYAASYYPADSTAQSYLNGTDNVSVTDMENGLLIDGKGNDTLVVFYPGAMVDSNAYLPILCNLSGEGVDCYIAKMPFNLAIFGVDRADEIIANTNYTTYLLAGHSLGGSMAASYAANHNVSGLILLASYATDKIDKPTLSIYGSNDNILNFEKYNQAKSKYGNFTEVIIDGGNHAQFGNYASQNGDGIASINSTSQQEQSVKAILNFINTLSS